MTMSYYDIDDIIKRIDDLQGELSNLQFYEEYTHSMIETTNNHIDTLFLISCFCILLNIILIILIVRKTKLSKTIHP